MASGPDRVADTCNCCEEERGKLGARNMVACAWLVAARAAALRAAAAADDNSHAATASAAAAMVGRRAACNKAMSKFFGG